MPSIAAGSGASRAAVTSRRASVTSSSRKGRFAGVRGRHDDPGRDGRAHDDLAASPARAARGDRMRLGVRVDLVDDDGLRKQPAAARARPPRVRLRLDMPRAVTWPSRLCRAAASTAPAIVRGGARDSDHEAAGGAGQPRPQDRHIQLKATTHGIDFNRPWASIRMPEAALGTPRIWRPISRTKTRQHQARDIDFNATLQET
jgi:hypothetical protein